MKSCSPDVLQCMNKVVPQFESMYAMTVKLADSGQSSNEEELFLCITELLGLFPSLIAGLSEGLLTKIPGISPLTVRSVLRKMEHLTIEMDKYSQQSKTLAYGDANTGETTMVESSFNSTCDTIANSTPPPLLSLDDAVEMLDEREPQQLGSDISVECVTSLTVSINTKLLRRIRGKRLTTALDSGVGDEIDNGSLGDQDKIEDHIIENRDQMTAASPEHLHDDVFNMHSPDHSDSLDIEVVKNQCHQDREVTGGNEGSTTSIPHSSESSDSPAQYSSSTSVPTSVMSPPSSTCVDPTTANQTTTVTGSNAVDTVSVPSSAPLTYNTTSTPVQSSVPPTYNTTSTPMQSSAPPTYNTTSTPVQSSAPSAYSEGATAGYFTPLLPKQPYIPTPIINISPSVDGLVVKWTLEQLDIHLASQVRSYRLCVFQGDSTPPTPNLWHTIGEVQAMKLPMACTLKYFEKGKIYHFAVRAIGRNGMRGQFSKSKLLKIY